VSGQTQDLGSARLLYGGVVKLVRTADINASPATVWQVMMDVERWPEWTPSTLRVQRHDDGPLRLGSTATLELRRAPKATWTVTQFEEGRSFYWLSKPAVGPAVLAGHVIEPASEGAHVTLSIEPQGVLGTLFSPLIVLLSVANVEAEAAGLKQRCEEISP
jgi:hypothetical protein